MSRIDRYVLAEVLPPFAFALLLYGGLAAVSAVVPRMQWLVAAPLADVVRWAAALLPQALVMSAPVALVLAVLLAFGRLAGDLELGAMQAGGVRVRRAAALVTLLGALVATLSLGANQWLVPRANLALAELYQELAVGRSGLARAVGQQLPLGDLSLTSAGVGADGSLLDVRVERWDGDVLTLVRAERGVFVGDDLELYAHRTQRLDLSALGRERDALATLRALVRLDVRAADADAPLQLTLSIDPADLAAALGDGAVEDARSLTRLAADAADVAASAEERRFAAVLLQRKLAESVANVALLLVAVPLSLRYARSRGVAFGLSLAVTLAWYLLLSFGQLFAQIGAVPVWLGPWAGTAALAGLGVLMSLRLEAA